MAFFFNNHLARELKSEKQAREELDRSKRALLNLMGDLEDRVKERTRELEETRQGLEARVKEKTADLELNRRAIMHMLKDLKGDVEKLRVVDKMKDEFLSIISHELRTPMAPLLDYINILKEGLVGDFSIEQKKIFEAMYRSARRELNLIDSLLDFSRLERGLFAPHKTRFSIKNLIRDLVENAQLAAKESGVSIKLGEFEEVEAEADENQISRVIAQLFDNALKFTSGGGKIEVSAQKTDHEIRVKIKDEGLGLAKENLEKVFDKFYQVDSGYSRDKGGMGLGLTICREIIKAHGGRIWAESLGLGQGSTFCFTLPLTSSPLSPPSADSFPSPSKMERGSQ
ncbi:HAMP domain-containing histidine kinase [Candidatus Saganbacteria bacterium]|nr:HAMP domain-containing histidine kinase [Candidatus Saganbacteria bacterium]